MTNKRLFGCVALILCMCLPLPTAASSADLRAMLQHCYDEADAAVTRKDVAASAKYYAPEYILVDQRGNKTDLKQWTQGSRENNALRQTIHDVTRITSLHIYGVDSATAMLHCTEDYVLKSPGAKPHRGSIVATVKDRWRRIAGRWLIVSSTILTMQATLDGVIQR